MLTTQTEQHPYQVRILLAVWGETFIEEFLQFSLRTLLAPGNIPAMAKQYPLRFIVLTKERNQEAFTEHSAFQKLQAICPTEFISIDDLIILGKYATTLTLAYDRAIKHEGMQMLKTYFVFLTSDYIMADGSLTGLMRYMQQGYSGICAGNFQVLKEDMRPFLQKHIDPSTEAIAIKPRALLKQSFQCLHPIVYASMINQDFLHNYRANRFYFRPNNNTLIGRFYLLHMLCIKPEIADYQIGSFCDYSFIPAMCPSDNIAVINDSDDYFVIETQVKNHELNFINFGKCDIKKQARALSEWTTKKHRENAKQSIYFHINDLTSIEKNSSEEKLNQLIETISLALQAYKEQPHDHHPYWVSMITVFNKMREKVLYHQIYDFLDLTALEHQTSLFKKIYYRLFGTPPTVYRWHRRYLEFQSTMTTLKKCIGTANHEKIIALYDNDYTDFMGYSTWSKKTLGITHHYNIKFLLDSKEKKLISLQEEKFQICLLYMSLNNIEQINQYLIMIKKIIEKKGKVIVFIPNEHNGGQGIFYTLTDKFIENINLLINTPFSVVAINSIHDNITLLGGAVINKITRIFSHNKKFKFAFYCLIGIPGSLFCFIRNSLPFKKNKQTGHCTNIILTLAPHQDE